MPVGLNLLFRLGRRLLAAPVEESGLLPNRYYTSQALAALEEDNFADCLRYLRLQGPEADLLVLQLLILRGRLLQARHRQEQEALTALLAQAQPDQQARYQEILTATKQALDLLAGYLREAEQLLAAQRRPSQSPLSDADP